MTSHNSCTRNRSGELSPQCRCRANHYDWPVPPGLQSSVFSPTTQLHYSLATLYSSRPRSFSATPLLYFVSNRILEFWEEEECEGSGRGESDASDENQGNEDDCGCGFFEWWRWIRRVVSKERRVVVGLENSKNGISVWGVSNLVSLVNIRVG